MGSRSAILVDTSIILEAARVGAWERLRAHEPLVTVPRCVEEALSGVPGSPLEVVPVTDTERAALLLDCEAAATLDDGERDLLAHAHMRFTKSASSDDFAIVCADQAAVKVAISMGLSDHLVSLEELLRAAGIKATKDLKGHYTRVVLSKWKTRHALGM